MIKERNIFMNPRLVDPEFLITRLRRNDLQVLKDKFLKNDKSTVILDFGARKSPYKSIFQGSAAKFLMADLVNEKGLPQAEVSIGLDGMLNHPSESVDVVLSLQVLEHVHNVDLYLKEASRVLKPGGILWLTTHGMWQYHPTPDDYCRWTLSGLKKTVAPHFDIENTQALMGAPAYAFMIYMHILWELSLKLNKLQGKVLNKIMWTKKWGKDGGRRGRIRNPHLYIGTLLYRIIAIPVNMIMMAIDFMTPKLVRERGAVVYRITAGKRI